MAVKSIIIHALAGLLAVPMAAPVHAQDTGDNRNLFETAGPKQTNKDFKPAPDTIKTNFGTTLTAEDAYRFARGEEVTSSTGVRGKLSRPLDFLVVADHA